MNEDMKLQSLVSNIGMKSIGQSFLMPKKVAEGADNLLKNGQDL